MKKLLVSVVALAMAFAVTSCGKEDVTIPEISLPIDELVVDLGDAEAALKNVTAKDDKDGDVTNSLTVEGLDYVGDGTLTYYAKDNAGNVGSVKKSVTIKPDKLFGNYLVKQNGSETGYNVEAKKSGSDNTKLIISNFANNNLTATLQGDGVSTVLTIVSFQVEDEDGVKGTITGKINYKKGTNQYEFVSGDYKVVWDDGEVNSFTLVFILK